MAYHKFTWGKLNIEIIDFWTGTEHVHNGPVDLPSYVWDAIDQYNRNPYSQLELGEYITKLFGEPEQGQFKCTVTCSTPIEKAGSDDWDDWDNGYEDFHPRTMYDDTDYEEFYPRKR